MSQIYVFMIGVYRAEMLVVNCTQSLINVRGLAPVMSSHCAGAIPPKQHCNNSNNTDTTSMITLFTRSPQLDCRQMC